MGGQEALPPFAQNAGLGSDCASEDVLQVRWLAHLPLNTQRFLKLIKALNLDELAIAAD